MCPPIVGAAVGRGNGREDGKAVRWPAYITLAPYKVLILPDKITVNAGSAHKLNRYLAGGGALVPWVGDMPRTEAGLLAGPPRHC